MTAFTVPRKTATTVTTNGVAQAGHHNPVDATAGPVMLTLPTGANEGGSLSIAKTDSSSNLVTITPTVDGAATLAYQGETLELIADAGGNWHTLSNNLPRGPLSATFLPAWTLAEAFTLASATRDANEAITTASVIWPDSATGTFTTDTASTAFPGAIDAYHVTHVLNGTTTTVTQPAVTRDAGGAVIAQPALTVA